MELAAVHRTIQQHIFTMHKCSYLCRLYGDDVCFADAAILNNQGGGSSQQLNQDGLADVGTHHTQDVVHLRTSAIGQF